VVGDFGGSVSHALCVSLTPGTHLSSSPHRRRGCCCCCCYYCCCCCCTWYHRPHRHTPPIHCKRIRILRPHSHWHSDCPSPPHFRRPVAAGSGCGSSARVGSAFGRALKIKKKFKKYYILYNSYLEIICLSILKNTVKKYLAQGHYLYI